MGTVGHQRGHQNNYVANDRSYPKLYFDGLRFIRKHVKFILETDSNFPFLIAISFVESLPQFGVWNFATISETDSHYKLELCKPVSL